MQVSNFSSGWTIEISWVDEDSSLVPRSEIKSGNTHFELCSPDHVWVLTATVTSANGHKSRAVQNGSGMGDEKSADPQSPLVVVLRASPSSMVDGRCTSVLWSPRCSLSVSQRLYAKQRKADIAADSKSVSPAADPLIHVQIFDGVATADSGAAQRSTKQVSDLPAALRLPDWRKMKRHTATGSHK